MKARRVENFEQIQNDGDFYWSPNDNPKRLVYKCPCGCGDICGVSVAKNLEDRGGNHPIWNWNNDFDNPTLTPSIQVVSGCKWHGYLTDGNWITLCQSLNQD